MAHFIQHLLDEYGYLVLSVALMLELLALPLPGEVLMTYTGLMVFEGHLNWILSILTAGIGASIGMTVSYWIGYRLGSPFVEKHGAKIHFGPDKFHKLSSWFERYGNKLLLIAFYIPGVRHFTGYFSGITRMPFRTYIKYAYTGAFLWTGLFISLGNILGPKWEQFHHTITKYLLIAGMIAVVIYVIVYLYKHYRNQIFQGAGTILDKAVHTFHSLGKAKLFVLLAFGVFLTLFSIVAGLIQDYISHDFADFDAVTLFIVQTLFNEQWTSFMNLSFFLGSTPFLLIVKAVSLIWIIIDSKDRLLEAGFLLYVIFGGVLWDEGLRWLFYNTGSPSLTGTFPSDQTLITVIFLGFSSFLLVRHIRVAWIGPVAFLLVAAISFLVGLSQVFFNAEYPSNIVAGYVFGGIWLSLNVVLLEIFRLFKDNTQDM